MELKQEASPLAKEAVGRPALSQSPQLNKISVFLSFSGAGGVERMMMNLVREFACRGVQVDLVLIRARGPHLANIPEGVRVIQLNASHTLTAIPELARYIRRRKPELMLVAKDRAGRAAILARAISGARLRIFVRFGTNLSESLTYKSPFNRWFRLVSMPSIYSKVDGIIGISQGVVEDIRQITGLPEERCSVIRNPVVDNGMLEMSHQPVTHPWYQERSFPIIVGAGRLSLQKDFGTLIKAFALMQKHSGARLIILGEGGKRKELERLISELGVKEFVAMPGFQSNPYSWIAHADLFVLSSRWEGSGNVLTEALALGVPSVATDCPSGPAETLAGGKYGKLVPVGNFQNLAEAMQETLDRPLSAEVLRQAASRFSVDRSARRYLEVMSSS